MATPRRQAYAQSSVYKDLWCYISFFSLIPTHKTVTEIRCSNWHLANLKLKYWSTSTNPSTSGFFVANVYSNWVARKSLEPHFPPWYNSLKMFLPPSSPYQLEGKATIKMGILLFHTKLIFFIFSRESWISIVCLNSITILYGPNSPLWSGLGNRASW